MSRYPRSSRSLGLIASVAGLALAVSACTSSSGSSSGSGSGSGADAETTTAASSTTAGSGPTSPAGVKPTAPSSSATPTAPAPVGPVGGPVPAGFVPYSVTFIGGGYGWVLGNAPCAHAPCTSIVRTRNNGVSWVGIPAPKAVLAIQAKPGQISGLRFADQLHGWAFGPTLYRTADGGATWTPSSLKIDTSTGPLIADLATSGGYAWAAVTKCESATECSHPMIQLFRTPVAADTWTAVGSPVTAFPAATDILTVHGAQAWLSTRSTIYSTTGGVLQTLSHPCTGESAVDGFAAVDANHLDALCSGNGAAGSAAKQLAGSSNGGRTWTHSATVRAPSGSDGIADNGAGVLLGADVSGASVVRRTTNDGQSFTAVLTDTGGGLSWRDLGFTTSSRAVVVLAGKALYLSNDSGQHWQATTTF